MKNKLNKRYPEFNNMWDDEKLPPPQILEPLFDIIGYSYPKNILIRRVNLLTKTEKNKCDKLWHEIFSKIEKIEDVIANRAEIKNDPWK